MGFVAKNKKGGYRKKKSDALLMKKPNKRATKVEVASKSYVDKMVKQSREARNYQVYNLMDDGDDEGQISFPLFPYAQGDGNGQRSGDSIVHKATIFNFHIRARHENPHQCRIIIFRWNEDTISSVPAPIDILQTLGAGGPFLGGGAYVDCHPNVETRKSYTIFYDRTIDMCRYQDQTLTSGTGTFLTYPAGCVSVSSFQAKVSSNWTVNYTGTTSETYANGHLYVMVVSDIDPSLNAELPQVEFMTRTYYNA